MLTLNQPCNLAATADVEKLRCPTLFLIGAEDPIVPSQVMRELSTRLPGSELLVLEEAAHSAYFEKAGEFNRHVLDFLRRRAAFQ